MWPNNVVLRTFISTVVLVAAVLALYFAGRANGYRTPKLRRSRKNRKSSAFIRARPWQRRCNTARSWPKPQPKNKSGLISPKRRACGWLPPHARLMLRPSN